MVVLGIEVNMGLKKSIYKAIKMASISIVLAFAIIVFGSWLSVESLPKSVSKKVQSSLNEFWGVENLTLHNFSSLADTTKLELEKNGVEGLFEISNNLKNMGYVVLAKSRSKFDYFNYAIYYDGNFQIKGVRILQYREDYGGEIANKRWLKQFEGKTANSPITIDTDIQGISGATISYRAITKGVKDITIAINTLKK